MNKIFGLLKKYYRYIILGIIAVMLLLLCVLFVTDDIYRSPYVFVAVRLLSIGCLLYTIGRNSRHFSKIPWCLLLLIFPFSGTVFFLLFSNGIPTIRLRGRVERSTPPLPEHIAKNALKETNQIIAERRKNNTVKSDTLEYLFYRCGFPASRGGRSSYYKSGEDAYPEIIKDLRCAKRFVYIEFFIIEKCSMFDEIMEILSDKAANGVDVRMIYDDFGNMASVSSYFHKEVEKKHPGVKCLKFHPVSPLAFGSLNCRDHRKIILVDGECCYTGGFNIADRYINREEKYGYWKDSVIRIEGRAVDSFTASFAQFWNAFRVDTISLDGLLGRSKPGNKGIIQPFFDSPYSDGSICRDVMLDIISRATSSLNIFSPYLIPDDALLSALCFAAERGVLVTVFAPYVTDKKIVFRSTKSSYRKLIKSGVKIYEYNPGFIHSKIILADSKFGYIGTSNIDYRSLYYNYECGMYLENEPVLAQIERDFEETKDNYCSTLSPDSLKRNIFTKLFDSVVSLFDPLF